MSKQCRSRIGKQTAVDSLTGKPAYITKSLDITDEFRLTRGNTCFIDYTQIAEGVFFSVTVVHKDGSDEGCGHLIQNLYTQFCIENLVILCQRTEIGESSLTHLCDIIRRNAPELN